MRFSLEKAENRREFFRSAARYGLLGLLTVVTAVVARTSKLAGQRCVNRGICGGCAQFEGCGLPQALSAKQARG
ncbi:MAG TPA: hypothetical protein VNT26_08045 [Candidatus Sulfotelmatobacter sp.]|nr:hypothetical protein [Candidatus Sulfotelmatobacter sp.]